MKIGPKKKKSSPSEDLTVVLIRGNGSPRSFRLSLPALHRSLTALGLIFGLAVISSIALLGYSLFRDTVPVNAEEPVAGEPAQGTGGLWSKLRGSKEESTESEAELVKEVSGLREDLSRLNAQMDNRATLANNSTGIIQLMSPRSTLLPESESIVKLRNPNAVTDKNGGRVTLNFELHNIDPRQRQEQGYIVVLAKTSDSLLSYPAGLFAPNQNILLDFSKGETFAISRFRRAEASFPLAPLEGKKVSFQILLFGTDGKVLANTHVENTP